MCPDPGFKPAGGDVQCDRPYMMRAWPKLGEVTDTCMVGALGTLERIDCMTRAILPDEVSHSIRIPSTAMVEGDILLVQVSDKDNNIRTIRYVSVDVTARDVDRLPSMKMSVANMALVAR